MILNLKKSLSVLVAATIISISTFGSTALSQPVSSNIYGHSPTTPPFDNTYGWIATLGYGTLGYKASARLRLKDGIGIRYPIDFSIGNPLVDLNKELKNTEISFFTAGILGDVYLTDNFIFSAGMVYNFTELSVDTSILSDGEVVRGKIIPANKYSPVASLSYNLYFDDHFGLSLEAGGVYFGKSSTSLINPNTLTDEEISTTLVEVNNTAAAKINFWPFANLSLIYRF